MANTNVYDQHDKAFANVSAYVVLKDGARVATVAFKHGAAVTAYVHWIGLEMAKGRAGGGGYDRKTAACADAVQKLYNSIPLNTLGGPGSLMSFYDAMRKDAGNNWERELIEAGFVVLQAV